MPVARSWPPKSSANLSGWQKFSKISTIVNLYISLIGGWLFSEFPPAKLQIQRRNVFCDIHMHTSKFSYMASACSKLSVAAGGDMIHTRRHDPCIKYMTHTYETWPTYRSHDSHISDMAGAGSKQSEMTLSGCHSTCPATVYNTVAEQVKSESEKTLVRVISQDSYDNRVCVTSTVGYFQRMSCHLHHRRRVIAPFFFLDPQG